MHRHHSRSMCSVSRLSKLCMLPSGGTGALVASGGRHLLEEELPHAAGALGRHAVRLADK